MPAPPFCPHCGTRLVESDAPCAPEEFEAQERARVKAGALYDAGRQAGLAAPAAPLFRLGDFTLHSSERTTWKIDCVALTDADLAALASILASVLPPFGAVEGVPSGGLELAAALGQYVSEGPLLIVDDVLTTGASLEAHRDGRDAIGAVLFARGPCPAWVRALFSLAAPAAPGWQEEVRRVIDEMRNGSRYKSHDLGFVDSVSANRVDEWADELEALLPAPPGAASQE